MEKTEEIPAEDVEKEPVNGNGIDQPSKILEEGLAACQEAQTAWENTDIETALAALDEAYSQLLKLDLEQNSPMYEEKNELRLLIAQRIQEIYASHLVAVGKNHNFIPLEENKYVMAEIKSFQTKEHKYFIESYKRSGRFRGMMQTELKKAGLPEDLSWIPLIESGFKIRAYSRARALGLWQFISSTGYRFGLKKNRWIDERLDPKKATLAAIQYLKELHSHFGDWTTVLAAYNCGEFAVQKVIRAQRINYIDNFWDLFQMLPRETARFVPRFIATLLIIKNPEKYGSVLPEPDSTLEYEIISINQPVQLSVLSKKMGLQADTLASLNPELRHKATPDYEFPLKVPKGYGQQGLALLKSLSRWVPAEASYIIHYVRRGETVSSIARRYRTSIRAIARLNRLRRNFLISPRQRLKIPSRYSRIRSYNTKTPLTMTLKEEKTIYKVKRGDSLFSVANQFNTTVENIKVLNNLKKSYLEVGQELIIYPGKPKDAIIYVVQKGDSPYAIAKRFKMDLNYFLKLNRLNRRSRIYSGQKLWVISAKQG